MRTGLGGRVALVHIWWLRRARHANNHTLGVDTGEQSFEFWGGGATLRDGLGYQALLHDVGVSQPL